MMHPALQFKQAAIAGPPGPAKAVSPNAIKPLILGTRLPSNGDPNAIDPAQAEQQAQQAAQDQQTAQNEVQAAKMQAMQAQHALKLQQQLNQHQKAMAQVSSKAPVSNMDNTLLARTTERLGRRMQKLQTQALKTRVHNGGIGLWNKQADEAMRMARYGKPWPANQPKPPAGGSPLVHVPFQGTRPQWSDWGNAAKEIWHNPEGLSEAAQFTTPWNVINPKGATPGTVGAKVQPLAAGLVNGVANTARHVANGFMSGVGVAPTAMTVHGLNAAKTGVMDAIPEMWTQFRQQGWNPLDWKTSELGKTKDTLGHAWHGATNLAQTVFNTTPVGMALTAGLGTASSAGLTPEALANKLMPPPAEPAPAAPAEPQAEAPAGGLQSLMPYLSQLWQFLQPYASQFGQWGQRQLSSTLPSQMAAGGHQIRDVYDAFR
jgi:hypothetical protein